MRKYLVMVLAGCLFGLAACGGTEGTDNASADVVAGGTDEIGGGGAGLQLPRSVEYAGLTWTITAATFDPGDDDDGPTARLDLTVTSSLDGTSVTYPASILALAHPDGSLVRADHFVIGSDDESRLKIGPGERVEGTLVYEVTGEVDLSTVSFAIDAEDETPALLPLAGKVPADPYPLVGTASGRSGPLLDCWFQDCFFQDELRVVVEARTASAALDFEEHRAPRGTMFVIVGVRISGVEGTRGGDVDNEFFRLRADGVDVGPIEELSEHAPAGASTDFEIAFPVPLATTTMTLSAGRDGTEAATFPVSIPPAG